MTEQVDSLPFGSSDKRRRYATERYQGAIGLNWYRCDPPLQALMRRHLSVEGLAWAEPHLDRVGELMGGPIAERAEITDHSPAHLERYDRWGREVSRVVLPDSFVSSRRDIIASGFATGESRQAAKQAGVDPAPLDVAFNYLLNQAEIGMACALGTGTAMVERLVAEFAPTEVRDLLQGLLPDGTLAGQTAQMFTERTGGSDLAALETTATPAGEAWVLNGFKWFVSNVNAVAFVALAKPEGAEDSTRGVAPFLVLTHRRDGSRNGIRIRRLKDKLGTKAVASGEVELVDAEGFLLAPAPSPDGPSGQASDGHGMARMMGMTNGARLGIATMGLGCARRALVETLCYTKAREAFGQPLCEHPLMQRKLAELIVEVEAAQLLVFDGYLRPSRLSAPLVKLRASRLGITAASDAIEAHGGNGYIGTWPVERILRDAQVNTIWEGSDNILCIDVRRAITKQDAHVALLERIRQALDAAPNGDDHTVDLVAQAADRAGQAVERWRGLDPRTAEARLFPLAQLFIDAYAGALLLEHARWEADRLGSDRKLLVARLYARNHLEVGDPIDRIDETAEDLERFKDLTDGTFVEHSAQRLGS